MLASGSPCIKPRRRQRHQGSAPVRLLRPTRPARAQQAPRYAASALPPFARHVPSRPMVPPPPPQFDGVLENASQDAVYAAAAADAVDAALGGVNATLFCYGQVRLRAWHGCRLRPIHRSGCRDAATVGEGGSGERPAASPDASCP